MTVTSGSKLVTSGLIINLDAGNRKAFAGIGSERVGGLIPAFGNWNGLVGTTAGYVNNGKTGVYLSITSANGGGVNWWYSTNGAQECSSNTRYMITAKVKWTSGATPNANLLYVRQFNSGGSQTSENGKFNSSQVIALEDGYYLAWAVFTTDSTTTSFYIHGYEYQNIQIYLEDVQCKQFGISDISSVGNSTSVTSNITFNNNKSLVFNGTSDYIDITTNLGTLSGYTFSYWAKRDAESRFHIGARGGSGFYQYGDNSWAYTHGGAAGEYYYPKSVSIPVSTWGHYTITYDGSYVRIYRNGVYEGAQASSGTADFTSGWRIGNGMNLNSGYFFQGSMGVFNMYNRALSAEEVKQNFNAHRGRYGI